MKNICSSLLKISSQVAKALKQNKPIVALQSTIISHGMPYPQNKECALSIEKTIKENGATPATIAIFNGKIHVGLQDDHIQKLASSGKSVTKVSRRDLPIILANKKIGATTVSGTMIGAHAAGIKIFVTGGIGGVHRGYQHTMDVSADLQELGRTPVAVVSAGVKSILDIPRTLEFLETKGVPAITYGSKYFPAFFSSSSGIESPFSQRDPLKIAEMIHQHEKLGLKNGMLVAVPNDNPEEGQQIESSIQKALKESKEKGIKGAAITPFLLGRVNELTQGKSLKSNISLVHNNARIGAKIAVKLNTLQMKNSFSYSSGKKEKVIVIGGSAVDYHMSPAKGRTFQFNKSCIVTSMKTLGGVGRNIAEVCAKLGVETQFVTAIGDDEDGDLIKRYCPKIKMFPIVGKSQVPTGRYFSLLDHQKNEVMGLSQMQIGDELTFDNVYEVYFKNQKDINTNDIVIIDGNFHQNSLQKMAQFCSEKGYFTVFEAKGQKSKRVIETGAYKQFNVLKMNKYEKQEMSSALNKQVSDNSWMKQSIGEKSNCERRYTDIKAIVTNGDRQIQIVDEKQTRLVGVRRSEKAKKTLGAGDTFMGAFCSMLLYGKATNEALKYGIAASKINIEGEVRRGESVIARELDLQNLEKEYDNL